MVDRNVWYVGLNVVLVGSCDKTVTLARSRHLATFLRLLVLLTMPKNAHELNNEIEIGFAKILLS
jgi:hypothetical protein